MGFLPVQMTPELRRIFDLPSREWDPAVADRLAEAWSPQLLNPHGKRLWDQANALSPAARAAELERLGRAKTPILMQGDQAAGLYDFTQTRGLIFGAPVGIGKSLESLLLCTLAYQHFGITQILLVVMASGLQQTHDDLGLLTQVWQAPVMPQVTTYHKIGQPGHAYYLCACPKCKRGPREDVTEEDEAQPHGAGLQPQMVILDESDQVRNEDSAVHRRLHRFHSNHPTPEVLHVSETGTLVRKTWANIRRPMIWALGPEAAPVPSDYPTIEALRGALDDKPRDGVRRDPGVLRQLADPEALAENELHACQEGWGNRLASTPGVVIIKRSSCDVPLHIRVIQAPDDPVLEDEYYRYFSTGETRDGVLLADALSQNRHETDVSVGHWNFYDPRPPVEWAMKRKAYLKLVKAEIDHSQRWGPALDSEKDVARKLKREKNLIYEAWKEIEPTFKPRSVSETISFSVLNAAAEWLKVNSPAIVWVRHSWAGEELSRITGVPYYAGKGKSKTGGYLGDVTGRESVILSAHANRRQRNLQMFNRNLILAPEHSAERLEQQCGRTHRRGQQRDVHVDFMISAGCSITALLAARSEARHVQTTTKMPQKILSVPWDWSEVTLYALNINLLDADDKRRSRWQRKVAADEDD